VAISASLVKDLRDKTGAGVMDCRRALEDTDGNMDEAVKLLRHLKVRDLNARGLQKVKPK